MTEIGTELRLAVATFAARPRVLVAVDFDGTLAPFVLDPLQARALPGGLEALRAAAARDGVTAAVASGRDVATLAQLTGFGPDQGVTLIGSHGAQTDVLDAGAAARLRVVGDDLEAIRSRYPLVRLEYKPSSVALHTRGVEPSTAAAATAAALEVGTRYPRVQVMPGKDVVELTVLDANKGSALLGLARATRSEATLYAGDDVTDERAFEALDPSSGDLTIKVGKGETAAAYRVADPAAVVNLLELFMDLRSSL